MVKRDLSGAKVLVTGASSGIGRAICIQLALRGARVLATARREEKLKDLKAYIEGLRLSKPLKANSSVSSSQNECSSQTISILPGDLTDTVHRTNLTEWVTQNWGSLDVLINNAGVGAIGPFESASQHRLRQIMEVDFFAPVELTRLLLPSLRRGKNPAILNVGSVLSHRAVPNKSEYCAAKFAMRGWSEALRVELLTDRIDVLMLSPSTTKSEFFDALVETDPDSESKSIGAMSVEQVAEAAVQSLVRSKRELILSLGGKLLVWSGRIFPGVTDRLLSQFAR